MIAWAIKHWTGEIYIDTVRRTRSEAKSSFFEQFGFDEKKWKTDSRFGVHRIIRVDVQQMRIRT